MTLLLLLLSCAAPDDGVGRAARSLSGDDRERRVEALERFASGALRPEGTEADRVETALRRFLNDRFDGEERALAVAALGTMRRSRAFLDRLGKERDDRVLRAAALALARGPESLFGELRPRLDRAKDAVERAVLVRMLGALPGEEARRAIRAFASAESEGCPRAAALLALDGGRDALSIAIGALDSEDPGVVAAAVEALTRLTRLPHGDDRARWRGWWEAGGEVRPLQPAAAGGGETRTGVFEPEEEGPRPYYFGIPVRGRKVAFCCDVSASMRYKLPLSYDQLARAVKQLPSASQFTVIFFNEFVMPWRRRLSFADPVTKELLVRHLPTIEVKSYTNLFDSLETALALPVDEIFLISDGEPNRGRKTLPEETLAELARLNVRRVRIHAVSVVRSVDGDAHVPLLRRIAEAHGGEYVERTLR